MKILLANDTGVIPHFGCQAVSDAHARMLGRAGHEVVVRLFANELSRFALDNTTKAIKLILADVELRQQIERVDAVVVNGEGTIHHGNGREYIALLGAAQKLSKATLLVNAVYQDSDFGIEILKNLDQFSVRDLKSKEFADHQGVENTLVMDSCLEAEYASNSALNFLDKDIVTDWHPARDQDTGISSFQFLRERGSKAIFLPFEGANAFLLWKELPASLETAGAIITGRHHAAYMAAMTGRPFVLLGSNTHKIEGLVAMLPWPVKICRTIDDLFSVLEQTRRMESNFAQMADFLKSQKPLSTFSVLGNKNNDTSGEQREIARLESDIHSRKALTSLILKNCAFRRSHEFQIIFQQWQISEKALVKSRKRADKLEKQNLSIEKKLKGWNKRPWYRRICRKIRI